MAASVEIQKLGDNELRAELIGQGRDNLPADVLVYAIDGPFFFGAVENFERALAQTHTDPKVLIIRLKRVPFMDITGLQTLEEVIQKLEKRGVVVLLCEANDRVRGKLERTGLLATGKGYFPDLPAALVHCDNLAGGASSSGDDAGPA